jgi:hypothetical protein
MIKIILFASIVILFVSCERKPFVEHKLKFEKVADGCNSPTQNFKMTSNFGGERYEFDRCLAANFTDDQVSTARQGDTVVVKFTKPAEGQAKGIFNLTLDIDSYPKYHFITIDGDTYAIVSAN